MKNIYYLFLGLFSVAFLGGCSQKSLEDKNFEEPNTLISKTLEMWVYDSGGVEYHFFGREMTSVGKDYYVFINFIDQSRATIAVFSKSVDNQYLRIGSEDVNWSSFSGGWYDVWLNRFENRIRFSNGLFIAKKFIVDGSEEKPGGFCLCETDPRPNIKRPNSEIGYVEFSEVSKVDLNNSTLTINR
jgi:hypothetical protein